MAVSESTIDYFFQLLEVRQHFEIGVFAMVSKDICLYVEQVFFIFEWIE